jgi:hypothetical protein
MPWRGPNYPGELPTLGWYVLDWAAENLIVPDGITAGEPLTFTDEQAQFILQHYAIDPDFDGMNRRGRAIETGRIVRRSVLLRLGRERRARWLRVARPGDQAQGAGRRNV